MRAEKKTIRQKKETNLKKWLNKHKLIKKKVYECTAVQVWYRRLLDRKRLEIEFIVFEYVWTYPTNISLNNMSGNINKRKMIVVNE